MSESVSAVPMVGMLSIDSSQSQLFSDMSRFLQQGSMRMGWKRNAPSLFQAEYDEVCEWVLNVRDGYSDQPVQL